MPAILCLFICLFSLSISLVFRSLKETFDEANEREDVKAIVVTGMQSASEINCLLCMECSEFKHYFYPL